jgi:4-hydroxy-tetrahydrodipicolinate reductase
MHEISYTSDIDQLVIRHEAFSREGFALGALHAAEYIAQKNGIFTMKEVLGL